MTMLRTLIRFLAAWTILSTLIVLIIAVVGMGPNSRAVAMMGAGLVLLWIVLGGTLMWTMRGRVRDLVLRIRLPWPLTFVLFCTLLALTEEAVTVSMTNLAPLFGVPLGAAYITASANYLDVVALHSVVVFVPMFIAWAGLLSWRSFSPFATAILFGITGLLAEVMSFGSQNLLFTGSWVLVYGLMVYLPAWTAPGDAAPPRLWTYPVAIFLPLAVAIPVALVILSIRSPG